MSLGSSVQTAPFQLLANQLTVCNMGLRALPLMPGPRLYTFLYNNSTVIPASLVPALLIATN